VHTVHEHSIRRAAQGRARNHGYVCVGG
jgi:hypothetical protein